MIIASTVQDPGVGHAGTWVTVLPPISGTGRLFGISLWGWPVGVPGAQHSPVPRGWVAGGTVHTQDLPALLTGTHRCVHPQPLWLMLLPVLLPHNARVPEASTLPTAPKIPSSPCVLDIARPSRDRELPGSVWLSIPGAEPGDQQAGQLWPGPWPAL